jgi:hypothetical protein
MGGRHGRATRSRIPTAALLRRGMGDLPLLGPSAAAGDEGRWEGGAARRGLRRQPLLTEAEDCRRREEEEGVAGRLTPRLLDLPPGVIDARAHPDLPASGDGDEVAG